MSPDELSRSIEGLMTPVQVAAHVKKLLADRDWLSEAEQDNLITLKLQGILSKLETKFQDNENLELQLKFLKEIGNRLDKRRAATEVDLTTYHSNVGREMGRIYDLALAHLRGALTYAVDPDEWDDAADAALQFAQSEAMKKAIE